MTDGRRPGLSEALRRADPRDLGLVLLAVLPLTALICAVNALSNLADIPGVRPWEPWSWEITSGAVIVALVPLPWLATALVPPEALLERGWGPKVRFALVHGATLLVFSAVHVAGFVALRHLVYELMAGGPYEFGDRFVYELRKDLISYGAYVAAFWLLGWVRRARRQPLRPVSFDIRDGARIIRAPLADIVAVCSAGNYVEFRLADGRRPLMRATLAAVEVELAPFGFVRAHRSWLVNAARVTGLRPDGSGDWTVELGPLEAPLSRRYPQALARLRG